MGRTGGARLVDVLAVDITSSRVFLAGGVFLFEATQFKVGLKFGEKTHDKRATDGGRRRRCLEDCEDGLSQGVCRLRLRSEME